MHRLLELLMKYKPIDGQKSDLCGIVFVNQRSVARVLCQWFEKLKELNRSEFGFLKVDWVVGNSSSNGFESLVASYSGRKQLDVIKKFRDDELNLLIATSVLEEGLDVRQCNVIIRYDRPKTFREYLQSKGRARAIGAHYYLMASHEDYGKIQFQLRCFKKIEEKIKNLNDKQSINNNLNANESENIILDEQEYKNSGIDDRITTNSVISVLEMCKELHEIEEFELNSVGNENSFEAKCHSSDCMTDFSPNLMNTISTPNSVDPINELLEILINQFKCEIGLGSIVLDQQELNSMNGNEASNTSDMNIGLISSQSVI
jgi:superfamily II DNA/RNA helicase